MATSNSTKLLVGAFIFIAVVTIMQLSRNVQIVDHSKPASTTAAPALQVGPQAFAAQQVQGLAAAVADRDGGLLAEVIEAAASNCRNKYLNSSAPVCPACPSLTCPAVSCPDVPACPACPDIPLCPTVPACPQCPQCPQCPSLTCPQAEPHVQAPVQRDSPCPACPPVSCPACPPSVPAAQPSCSDCAYKTRIAGGFDKFLEVVAHLPHENAAALAAAVSAWDTLTVVEANALPASVAQLREALVRCVDQYDPTSVPEVEEVTGCACGKQNCKNFVPWRRYSSYASLAYCVGQLPDVLTHVETFISYGGTTLPFAQGMKSSGKANWQITGWEVVPDVIAAVNKISSIYPQVVPIAEYTLQGAVTVDGVAMKLESARGSMVDFCSKHVVHSMLVDGGWGTKYTLNGKEEFVAENWVALDICKPKYFLQVSTNRLAATSTIWNVAVNVRKSYVEVAHGWSRGVACGSDIATNRAFRLMVRVDE